uniref:Uncharacterized protein n=1 Tax=Ditylenchus dipsaci TaxID=166011 RepID=A0A915EH03_9BILA
MFSEGNTLSWTDDEAYIKDADNETTKLGVIYKLAMLQNKTLDDAMLENMYHEHLTIVTLVNDREQYIRNQIIAVGSNYLFLLKLLLGTGYDRLISKVELTGHYKDVENKQINLKEFESALKTRLTSLAEYVNGQNGRDDKQEKNKNRLNFDPYPVNTSTFDLIQLALEKPAVEYNVLGQSAIVLAVGDSAVTSHFFAGNGTTTGRINVQGAVRLLKEYNDGLIKNKQDLIDKINHDFEKIKKEALFWARKYVKTQSPQEMDKIAVKAMCAEVNKWPK